MDRSQFAFTKLNYILLIIGIAVILTGFILMAGSGSTEEAFNPDIFSDTRIKVAPMVSLAGFLFIIAAILWKGKRPLQSDKKAEPASTTDGEEKAIEE